MLMHDTLSSMYSLDYCESSTFLESLLTLICLECSLGCLLLSGGIHFLLYMDAIRAARILPNYIVLHPTSRQHHSMHSTFLAATEVGDCEQCMAAHLSSTRIPHKRQQTNAQAKHHFTTAGRHCLRLAAVQSRSLHCRMSYMQTGF